MSNASSLGAGVRVAPTPDAAQTLAQLAMASNELSAKASLDDVIEATLDLAIRLNRATVATVVLRDPSGTVTAHLASLEAPARAAASRGELDVVTHDLATLGTIADIPAGLVKDCLGDGRPVWAGVDGSGVSQGPPHGEAGKVSGILEQATLALAHPISGDPDETVAAFAMGWRDPPALSDEVRATAEMFCQVAASGLKPALRAADLTDLAQQMRKALLPANNSHRELDVAVDYVPAMNTIGFGGDWFDFVDRSEHSVVLVVGDIAGHGVPAAARMALAQGAVRGLALRSELGAVPSLTSWALAGEHREMVATLGLIKVDLADMTVSCVLAGHPPPMMRRPDGTVERLGGRPAPPIGMVPQPVEPTGGTDLYPGCLIVLYTDGLIERRDANLEDRLDLLEGVVAGLDDGLDAAGALREICEELLAGDSEDDVAILVLRVQPPG